MYIERTRRIDTNHGSYRGAKRGMGRAFGLDIGGGTHLVSLLVVGAFRQWT